MKFPDSKNIILISFLLRPNFSTKSSGLPDFYRVKLDVIGNKYKLHFWNMETSYDNALCSDTCPNYIGRRKILQGLSALPSLLFLALEAYPWEERACNKSTLHYSTWKSATDLSCLFGRLERRTSDLMTETEERRIQTLSLGILSQTRPQRNSVNPKAF